MKASLLYPCMWISPALLILGVFTLLPLAAGLALSLVSWDGLHAVRWEGLGNYVQVLQDQTFWQALVWKYWAMILPYTSGGLLLSIFLLRAYFESIPQELSDAARIDGCTYAHAFVSVILPVTTPALATVAILQFKNSWNEFFLALIFIHQTSIMTLPLGLQSFFYLYRVQWSYLFAALSMALVPIIVVYLLMQRQFINGLTAGALKG